MSNTTTKYSSRMVDPPPRIYLDEMSSSPHFPKPVGQLPETSTIILPDLKRTGIKSKFSRNWPDQPTDVKGRLTEDFLQETISKMKRIPMENTKLMISERHYHNTHRINLGNTLMDIDQKREERYYNMRNQLRQFTNPLGFDSIDSVSLCMSPGLITSKSLPSLHLYHQNTNNNNNNNIMDDYQFSEIQILPRIKKKIYSRHTMFQSLLDDSKPSSSFHKKRYGILGRPLASIIITPSIMTPISTDNSYDIKSLLIDSDPREGSRINNYDSNVRTTLPPVDLNESSITDKTNSNQ